MQSFEEFFREAGQVGAPHGWQQSLAEESPGNRLIRIPTGFGKTLGVLSAWLWHRVQCQDEAWPRRLVWCLPMRVLVEQVRDEVQACLSHLGRSDGELGSDAGAIGVHLLMGGADMGEWPFYPERCAVLIGTQDMLLSRAMNRGYAAPRARWPMEFGLLNQDCLWVMDEVQLMDVGLATSGQLQAFRQKDQDAGKAARPCFTWWMSATLQADWLAQSPDTAETLADLPETRIEAANRVGHLWGDVAKPCEWLPALDEKAFAKQAVDQHCDREDATPRLTLVVVNTVERAVKIAAWVREDPRTKQAGIDTRLVHSRFRPQERAQWREEFLRKDATLPAGGRIIVATQVVEAGVDISANVLMTELAPWPSLVQRFGRCARRGGVARVYVVDLNPKDDKAAAPYTKRELDAAREALGLLPDVAPLHLEAFEEAHPERLARLYPYDPAHLLLRHELDELFDTSPDLSGADIDISRFIRSGEERDLQVFWAEVPDPAGPPANLRPSREALCAVPFLKAREWLCGDRKATALLKEFRKKVWIWDWLEGAWTPATESRNFYPGQTVLVSTECGGYDKDQGWAPKSRFNALVVTSAPTQAEQADAAQDDESLSEAQRWQTIATHGRQVGIEASAIAQRLIPQQAALFGLAGRWHDTGKVHEAFNGSIVGEDRLPRHDLAKAPQKNWLRGRTLYPMPDGTRRPGFRHELASVLALFGVLRRHQPDHAALLGLWRDLLERAGMPPQAWSKPEHPPSPLEQEVLALDASSFNLLAYLVCAHHGKLRLAWHACPADQAANGLRLRIRGIEDGERLPEVTLADADGACHVLPETSLNLAPAAAGLNPVTGAGWTERVLGLLDLYGPFTLAWLEALLRAADQRASRALVVDPLLENDDGRKPGLDGSDSPLAQAAGSREARDPLEVDSAQRGGEHGLRGRAGGRGDAGSGTRPPAHATRYLETTRGRLSYLDLAPHLAEAVRRLESAIESGEFDDRPIDGELIETLHRRLCAELTPQLAGWRHINVVVGAHTPPDCHRVPLLVREYGRDLEARLAALPGASPDILLEALAFAEGRLLSIHPCADFNGRLTRVLLRLLLRRLDLPWVDLLPSAGKEVAYLAALAAADRNDWRPLMAVWRERFTQEVQP